MKLHFGYAAALALALGCGATAAQAQTYYVADVNSPATAARPLNLSPVERTTIYRTIVPRQGRKPIVHERVVRERYAPQVRERVVQRTVRPPAELSYGYVPPRRAVDDYAYGTDDYAAARDDYAYVPPQPVVRAPVTTVTEYPVGTRLPQTVPLATVPQTVAVQVPAVRGYRYFWWDGRLLLVDPVTNTVVADIPRY